MTLRDRQTTRSEGWERLDPTSHFLRPPLFLHHPRWLCHSPVLLWCSSVGFIRVHTFSLAQIDRSYSLSWRDSEAVFQLQHPFRSEPGNAFHSKEPYEPKQNQRSGMNVVAIRPIHNVVPLLGAPRGRAAVFADSSPSSPHTRRLQG